jgi:hypothetical protein
MTLDTARALLVRNRMDWNRPHLPWVPGRFYRMFRSVPR